MCVSMYDGCLVGKARQWCFVENVGTWCRLKCGFGRLVECIVWSWRASAF